MAPPGRQSDIPLWQTAYHKDLQDALEGIKLEVWGLAAAFNLLPCASATEWNALTLASPWFTNEAAPGKDLVDYVLELASEDAGSLRCRGANRPPPPSDI